MSKKLRIIGLGLFFWVLYMGMNYYVYRSVLRGLEVSEGIKALLGGIVIVVAMSFIFGMFLRGKPYIHGIAYIGNLWLGMLSIAISLFLIRDLLYLFWDFNLGGSTILFSTGTIAAVLYAFYNGTRVPRVREVTIPSSKINSPKEEITITQLSDVHVGILTSKKWLKKIVEKTNELQSDIIVITGDLTDDKMERIPEFLPILRELQAPMGKFTIIGNHEVYHGLKKYYEFTTESGLTPLRNKKVVLSEQLELYGVDDVTVEKYLQTPVKLEETLVDVDPSRYSVLLFHQPVRFTQAVDLGIDLQLSGHTHNGQIPPLEWIIGLYFRYPKGLYQKGEAHIYTSPGTGVWGPPLRFASKNEITRFRIVPKKT